MAVDNAFFVKQLQKKESILVAFCAYTNMPFVECDSDTFDDQVWVFENETLLQNFAKPYTEEKLVLQGRKILNKDLLSFFSSLYFIGVNQVVYQNETSAPVHMELSELVSPPDYSKLKPENRPLMNPGLQLTGLYFMQEATRPVPNEQKPELRDLEEEFSSNIVRSKFLLPIVLQNGPGTVTEKLRQKKYQTPAVKTKDGTMYQPIMSDQTELQKFAQGRQMLALTIPFNALGKGLPSNAKGYMLNPAGYHAVLTREVLAALPKRFPQQTEENSGRKA